VSERPHLSRKGFLTAASGLVAGVVIHTRADALDLSADQAVSETQGRSTSSQALGRPPSEIGQRAPGEQPRRRATRPGPSASSQSPLQDFEGIITPADLHFERHHGGIAEIAAEDYSLLIHGMVDRPTVFSLDDLKRFPSTSRIAFLECSGNGGSTYTRRPRPQQTPQMVDGLTSTSEWTGVPLRTLLAEVGVQPEASWVLAEGSDAALLARSVPLEKCLDDALIAYGQNGEALRPEQGYPARLFLPGWEGNANVKWLRRLEVTNKPVHTREETSKYTDPLADGTARQFSFVMDAKSLITFPAYPYQLPEPGWWEIRGLAWSGRGKVTRVEVSTNGGRSWENAELQEPVLDRCHTRFRHLWNWGGAEAVIMSRATDETGYVQPPLDVLMAARGPGTMYHWNHIRSWQVARDGSVTFAPGGGA
jgi:sulfane dehydrogenase subunit SoxC